jgi:hypothetical protein
LAESTITIELQSDIEYVSGRVNGVSKVFEQDEVNPTKWRTTVEKSPNDTYDITIEARDYAGNVTTWHETIEYYDLRFVFDRTQDDVDRVKELSKKNWDDFTAAEKKEWNDGMKGAINASDIKRIKWNINELAKMLDIEVQDFDYNTIYLDLPFRILLEDVEQLRQSEHIYSSTPKTPEYPILTYDQWNDVERILHDIYLNLTATYKQYAGTV